MKKCFVRHYVLFALLVGILANACGWAFNTKLVAHELDHAHHHVLSLDPAAHLDAHHHSEGNDDDHLDAATHLYLHAVGQYQPFFFMPPLIVPAFSAIEILMAFVLANIPDSILDSPLRPPRSISLA
ncbi:MAG: hypothetical protein ABS69_07995 [Nitrosomonadales bacterium SCN 54-20]|nr:MAG: hypothetical protein ABS69_07995 [Nitrosomonadales bacterium SCN 54-20]